VRALYAASALLATLLGTGPASAQGAAPVITMDEASQVIAGARVYAAAHNLTLSFVVDDAAGHIVMAARMDGAAFGTLAFSEGKAYASAAMGGLNGAELIARYHAEPWIWGNAATLAGNGPMLAGAGTFPIKRGNAVVGSFAASGAGPDEDDAAARAGIASAHMAT
jgi:glc operon protein GlcG